MGVLFILAVLAIKQHTKFVVFPSAHMQRQGVCFIYLIKYSNVFNNNVFFWGGGGGVGGL